MRFFSHPTALFVLALLFFVCGTWSLPLIDRDEPRFAEAAREMRERGDWVVPYFNNNYRFDKPPMTYWAQVPAYRVFGENDFAARLPSVIAGALTVLAVFGFAKRLYGTETALGAALIFMTCFQAFMHAKGAVADMIMTLFFTLSMWAGWELLASAETKATSSSSRSLVGWWLLFYGSLAAGFLTKGPEAWFPLIVVGLYLWQRRRAGAPLSGIACRFRFVTGVVVVLVVIGLWGIPALVRTHGEFFKVGIGKHVVGRSLTPMEGHGSGGLLTYLAMLPFYFVTIFLSFFPWSIRLPWFVKRLRAQPSLRNEQRFLLLGIALVFGVFTLIRTKLPHYTLPALPLLAILLARELQEAVDKRGSIMRWSKVTLVGGFAVSLLLFPVLARWFPAHGLIQKSAGALTPEMEFASSTDFQEPSLVWYARKYVHGWHSPMASKKLAKFMAKPGPRFCVAPSGVLQPAPEWQLFETKGFSIAQGKSVSLQLMVKPQ